MTPNAIWTAEPPREAGWYWMRDTMDGQETVEWFDPDGDPDECALPPTCERSTAPIESAEELASLRARAEVGEEMYRALQGQILPVLERAAMLVGARLDECDEADWLLMRVRSIISAWEAAK